MLIELSLAFPPLTTHQVVVDKFANRSIQVIVSDDGEEESL